MFIFSLLVYLMMSYESHRNGSREKTVSALSFTSKVAERNDSLSFPHKTLETIDMKTLEKQRLKPWYRMTVIRGEKCPGESKDSNQEQCPLFVGCAGELPEVRFCRNAHVNFTSKEIRRITAPIPIAERSTHQSFDPLDLPWDPYVIRLNGTAFINKFGHVFTASRQYLHGGCQVSCKSIFNVLTNDEFCIRTIWLIIITGDRESICSKT